MGSTIAEFIQLIVDAVIYIAALTLIALSAKTLVSNSYGVARFENVNTTIAQTDSEPEDYVGYTDARGDMIYEGTLDGSCVFEEILSADKDLAISINGTNISDTELESYRRSSEGKVVLKNKLKLKKNYYRMYSTDTNGEVSAVDYIEY